MCVWTFVYETVGIHRCQKKALDFLKITSGPRFLVLNLGLYKNKPYFQLLS